MLDLSFSWESWEDCRLSSAPVSPLIEVSQTLILAVKHHKMLTLRLPRAWSITECLAWASPALVSTSGVSPTTPAGYHQQEPEDISGESPGCCKAVCLGSPCWSGTNHKKPLTIKLALRKEVLHSKVEGRALITLQRWLQEPSQIPTYPQIYPPAAAAYACSALARPQWAI